MNQNQLTAGAHRNRLVLAALAYTAFLVYGSLVPLEFRVLPWGKALAQFSAIPWLQLGVGSRADLMANLILYMPLGFLWMGALTGRGASSVTTGMSAILCGSSLVALALAIEFAQQFFPPRTVSLNDLYAESAGGALGIALWTMAGRKFLALGGRFHAGGRQAINATLIAYGLGYLFLSLFPYDFLLSADEWREHLGTNKTGWLFANECGLGCQAKLVVELLAAVPFGLLLRRMNPTGHISMIGAVSFGVLFGLTIELLQLGIASGISQGVSVMTRAAGVLLGTWLPGWAAHCDRRRLRPWVRAGLVLAILPYLVGLASTNHWLGSPWIGAAAALDHLPGIRFTPFYYHYYTSEAVALVSLVLQAGLYAPLGAGLWLWRWVAGRKSFGLWFPVLLSAMTGIVIEAGKLFVPGQHPDPSNVLIAASAAAITQAVLAWLFPAIRKTLIPASATRPEIVASTATPEAIEPSPVRVEMRTIPPARFLSGGLLIAALWSVWGYPQAWAVVLLLLVLAGVCWRWQGSWLIVVPAALPLLDGSYFSGRLFWNEFDSLLLLVLAVTYARSREHTRTAWPGKWPLVMYGVSVLASLFIGLLPLAALDLNAFSHYTSSYHALPAVKGFAFALAFLPLIQAEWHRQPQRFSTRLALGMTLGLVLELAYVVWERVTFSGLMNFATGFRITGSFPGMHIGGASIEAYLVIAAPFAWLWAWQHRRIGSTLAAGGLYALAAYGIMVTFSRGGQAAFVLATILLLGGFMLLMRKAGTRAVSGSLVLLVGVVAAGLVAWPIVSGKFSQSRLATIQVDMGTRTAHWRDAINILAQAGNPVLGAGSGTFPSAFYWYSSTPERPASYAFVREAGNVLLRLGGGESLYFEQKIPLKPRHAYRLQMDVRSSAKAAALTVPVCEKALLYSFSCVWNTVKLTANDTHWQHREILIRTDNFNEAGSLFVRPVKLSLFNQDKTTTIDVDNVVVLDEAGRNLLSNGDFTQGMQDWFFSTDSHLAWHAKNLFIHVLFEQGWLGLIAFVLLIMTAGISLLKRAGRDAMALTLMVSLTAFLVVGMVDSLIDEPRLDFLFFWLLLIALTSGGKVMSYRRRKHSHPHQ